MNSVDCLYAEVSNAGINQYTSRDNTKEYSVWVRNTADTLTTFQSQPADTGYKYIAFSNTGTINFTQSTECELLLLDGTKYKIVTDFFNGFINVSVGSSSSSSFGSITSTGGTAYNSGIASIITGSTVTYNAPIVIIRYLATQTTTTSIPSTGFLKYDGTDWKVEDLTTIPTTLEELTGSITTSQISDFPTIPTSLNQLPGTVPYSSITSTPTIPTSLGQLGGTITKNKISDFPTIPTNFFTKSILNQILANYDSTIIIGGGFGLTLTRTNFKISMNFMSNLSYDNGMNASAYISCRVKSGTVNTGKYLFAWVYFKYNNGTNPNTNTFRSGIIASDNNSTWGLSFQGSSGGDFFLNIRVDATPAVTQLHVRTS